MAKKKLFPKIAIGFLFMILAMSVFGLYAFATTLSMYVNFNNQTLTGPTGTLYNNTGEISVCGASVGTWAAHVFSYKNTAPWNSYYINMTTYGASPYNLEPNPALNDFTKNVTLEFVANFGLTLPGGASDIVCGIENGPPDFNEWVVQLSNVGHLIMQAQNGTETSIAVVNGKWQVIDLNMQETAYTDVGCPTTPDAKVVYHLYVNSTLASVRTIPSMKPFMSACVGNSWTWSRFVFAPQWGYYLDDVIWMNGFALNQAACLDSTSALCVTTVTITSTYTGYVAPNSSQIGNWIIPFFWIMIPTALMMGLARMLDFDSSKFVFMTITGIVFGCLFGVFGQAIPLGVLVIFISVYVLYIWRARAQGQSLPGPVESE